MLQIVFLILKIILFLMLAAVGIFLAAVLAVLLVPVRYRVRASLHESFRAEGRVSWLFRLISVTFTFESGGGDGTGLETDVRLLWLHPFREGESGREEPFTVAAQETHVREEEGAPPGRRKAGQAAENRTEGVRTGQEPEGGGGEEESRAEEEEGDGRNGQEPGAEESQEIFEAPSEFPVPPKQGEQAEDVREDACRERLFSRLASRARGCLKRGRRLLRRVRSALCDIRRTAARLLEQKDRAAAFLRDERNKKTFGLLCREAKRLLLHLSPRLEGSLAFGLEDPWLMGKLLTVLAVLYPLYGRSLRLTPVFDRSVLEGEIKVRGRVRFGVFAASGLRLLLDRNFRRLAGRLLKEGGI